MSPNKRGAGYVQAVQMHIFEQLVVGPISCNCYIAGDPDTREAVVIDPGGDVQQIFAVLQKHNLTVVKIVATHAHFDHVLAAEELKALTGAQFVLHHSDQQILDHMQERVAALFGIQLPPPPKVDGHVADGDEIVAGETRMEVLHTPGHSPGSVSLVVPDQLVFSGDTLFAGSVGRFDLPGGDGDLEMRSIRERLIPLGDLAVYPGHGPPTTIGREKLHNPFLQDF